MYRYIKSADEIPYIGTITIPFMVEVSENSSVESNSVIRVKGNPYPPHSDNVTEKTVAEAKDFQNAVIRELNNRGYYVPSADLSDKKNSSYLAILLRESQNLFDIYAEIGFIARISGHNQSDPNNDPSIQRGRSSTISDARRRSSLFVDDPESINFAEPDYSILVKSPKTKQGKYFKTYELAAVFIVDEIEDYIQGELKQALEQGKITRSILDKYLVDHNLSID